MTTHSTTSDEPCGFDVGRLDYRLPPERIAQTPLADRDAARLLVVDRGSGRLRDASVADLPDLLKPADLLILNDTKVVPAKFSAYRKTGGRVSGLFVQESSAGEWQVLLEGSRRLRAGEILNLQRGDETPIPLELVINRGEGNWLVRTGADGTAEEILRRFGTTPLPPYIRREAPDVETDAVDRQRYQTVYAKHAGAIAAPTAGLHFTDDLLQRIRRRGIDTVFVTLHVGLGTFKPVTVDRLSDHLMHEERYELSGETARAINDCRDRGGRIVAVGTTTVRVLEGVADASRTVPLQPGPGSTSLFIFPPYRFRVVDVMLTNFHLPRSTLLAMVMAFAGVEPTRQAYEHAVKSYYRFYSYGDAMLIA